MRKPRSVHSCRPSKSVSCPRSSLRIQGHERVGLQLRERDILGVVRRSPAELFRQIPRPPPEDCVAEKPDRQPLDAGKALARGVGGELAPVDCLVQGRQRLRTEEGRGEQLMLVRDLAITRQLEHGAGVDHEPGQRKSPENHAMPGS